MLVVLRVVDESNEGVFERFGMFSKGEEINCGVVEIVKHSILR